MNSDRLLCQLPSTLVTAHADMESQLRVCAWLCMSLPLLCPRDTALPGLPALSWALARGQLLFLRLALPWHSACWMSSLPTSYCPLPLRDPAWIPLPSTFPPPNQGKADFTPPLPSSGLSVDWSPVRKPATLFWTRVVWGIKIDAEPQPPRLQ